MTNRTFFSISQPATAPPNFVLIDGALWGFDLKKAKNKNKAFRSLYRGEMGEALDKNAPYLFEVEQGGVFEKWIKSPDPVERRVTWLQSDATLDELRQHLRRFLRMKNEEGGMIYFRFYDPLVLNVVLPHLTEPQRREFFNKISYIEIEDKKIEERIKYYLTEEYELVIEKEELCG